MKVIFLCILFAVPVLELLAAEPAVCEKLRRHYADTTHLQIDFEQSIYWSVREKTSKKRGSAVLAPENRFRVEIGNDLWVCDGVTCSHYNKENNQVIIRNFSDLDITTQPSHLLSTLLTNYRFEEKSTKGKEMTLVWHPDSAASREYTAITLTVIEATGTVTSLTFTDTNSNIHTYQFKNTIFGRKVPAATFEFEAPNNAHIIDHRH
jgi:outer membrane lipoprotein-sorting protein